MSVYFDNAACELPIFEVKQYVKDNLDLSYNASAIYGHGVFNREVIENVRKQIAKKINCDPEEIYFTSGATEANCLAINGYLQAHPNTDVISTTIEHSSINDNPYVQKRIKVDRNGFVDIQYLKNLCDKELYTNDTLFVVQHGNNEIGCVQDLYRIRKAIPEGVLFVDAAQTFGKVEIDVKKLNIDMLSASARKIGGLGATGFLYVRKGIKLNPQNYGAQENGLRGGTYFDLGIGAFGVALEECSPRKNTIISSKRTFLLDQLSEIKNVKLIGTRSNRLPGIVLIKINGISLGSQELVGLLDSKGFEVSSGSACHAGTSKFSHVLEAIGETPETAPCVIRISLGVENSVQEIQEFIKVLRSTIRMFKV